MSSTTKNIRFPSKKAPLLIFIFFLCLQLKALPSKKELRSIKLLPKTDLFFTQTENCYQLDIPGILPAKVQMDLPELPLGTRFISSKKEEYISPEGERGTSISLWFTFSESGDTRLSPLMVRIDGRTHYFEFQKVYVYENPNLLSPLLQVLFPDNVKISTDKKTGKKSISVKKGEKITFSVTSNYAVQVYDFKWSLPKNSIFSESRRYEFAEGKEKIENFTSQSKLMADFSWQILKEGTYGLPEITASVMAYNGSKKQLSLPANFEIIVKGERAPQKNREKESSFYNQAFEKTLEEDFLPDDSLSKLEDYKKEAERSSLSLFDRIFSRKYGIFAGGKIFSVPEESSSGQSFSGGQKVRISERAGEWIFIECKDFSGWTKSSDIFEIK